MSNSAAITSILAHHARIHTRLSIRMQRPQSRNHVMRYVYS